ncbi:MAG TPA: TonB-dependent receptor [Longimicrobium sp.]
MRPYRTAMLLLCALALACTPAWAQGGAVAGRVTGPGGQPIAGARVAAIPAAGGAARRTAVTGEGGAFRLANLPAGAYRVRAQRFGYTAAEQTVTVAAGAEARAELVLAEESFTLEAIQARAGAAEQRERTRFETEAGVTSRVITGAELKVIPGLGEADIMRAVEVLPGVVSTSDFSSAFNVRGGSADQNLVLLDGFPIFNPFHLGGLFSVFNGDVIARAELLAGGFGAEYGGRVSSVLNVETEPGTQGKGVRGAAGVSILATRLALRGDLPMRDSLGRRGGWLVSARRSYFDALLAPVVDFPYHLTDLQLGVSIPMPRGGTLRLTGYGGQDVLDLSDFEAPGSDDEEEEPEDDSADDILRIRWNWGNQVAGAHWSQPLGRWTSDTRLGFSRYAEALTFVDFGDTRFESAVSQWQLRSDFGRMLGTGLALRTGVEATLPAYRNLGEAGGTVFFSARRRGTLASGYGQLRWEPSPLWIVEPGLRADVWTAGGHTRPIVSPRLAAKRFLGTGRDAAVKASVGRYTQFLHSLRDENLPVSNDTWITADRDVPAVVSDQVQAGIEKFWGDRWYVSAEAYARRFRGLTELNPADDPNRPGDDLIEGRGRSYGFDLLLKRSSGRLTGWTTLSLLRATRTFPDPTGAGLEGVPQTVTFPPIFDRRVDLDVVAQYRLGRRTELGGRFNFGSGVPYSRPVAQIIGFETDVVGGGYRLPRPFSEDPELPVYVVPGRRNQERYPAYHRLDVTLRRRYERSWGTLTPYVQVLNTYNQRNVLFYFYNYSDTPATRSGISMFPVLPTIGVEATF